MKIVTDTGACGLGKFIALDVDGVSGKCQVGLPLWMPKLVEPGVVPDLGDAEYSLEEE